MTSTIRILGIDPGSHKLGVGCVDRQGRNISLIRAETIQAPTREDLYPRLRFIALRLDAVFDDLRPSAVAIETTFFGKNAQSAFRLGIARGVVVAACLQRDLPIFEYAPAQVKASVTGSGRADKTQVQKMLGLILGTPIEMGFDASDAIAIALCHAHSFRG